jgi:hypothetical protein
MHRTQCRAKHVPEAASLRTGGEWAAQAPNSGCARPSAGARCGKAARRDLSGGAGVTRSPTATAYAACGISTYPEPTPSEIIPQPPYRMQGDGVNSREFARDRLTPCARTIWRQTAMLEQLGDRHGSGLCFVTIRFRGTDVPSAIRSLYGKSRVQPALSQLSGYA